jgi:hypothetical protein
VHFRFMLFERQAVPQYDIDGIAFESRGRANFPDSPKTSDKVQGPKAYAAIPSRCRPGMRAKLPERSRSPANPATVKFIPCKNQRGVTCAVSVSVSERATPSEERWPVLAAEPTSPHAYWIPPALSVDARPRAGPVSLSPQILKPVA